MNDPAVLQSLPSIAHVPLPLPRVLRIAEEYEAAGRYEDAEELLGSVLDAIPRQPDALHLLGVLAFRRGRLQEAARLMEEAIAQHPGTPLYYRNICTVYEQLGRLDEGIAAGRRAVELAPHDAEVHHNLAVVHQRLLQLDEAIACARRAISLAPSLPAPHLALAEALLLRGNFAAGWEEYEWRFQVAGAEDLLPGAGRQQWDGTPGPQLLLLIADQGFGDAILFARYIAWVQQRCPNVMLVCGPPLQRLVQHNYPSLPLLRHWTECREFHGFCPLSGLPRLHGTSVDTIPAEIPYLRAATSDAAAWKRRLDRFLPASLRRIGIVWAGRPQPPNRSIGLKTLAPLCALDDVALIALQAGPAQDEVGAYYGQAPMVSIGNDLRDFMDTAAVIDGLDLVITIDTAVAHLAGAMGKPVWVILPYSPDWRWLLRRDDSPWYPTARLFRQPAPQQWGPAVMQIAEELGRHTIKECNRRDKDAGAVR